MKEINDKTKSGGRREGAGRKKGINQTPFPLRLDNDLVEYVKSKSNRNRFINACIREAMNAERGRNEAAS